MVNREAKKWWREERARVDRAQAKLNLGLTLQVRGSRKVRNRPAEAVAERLGGLLLCPFCLYEANLAKFLVSSKSGISRLWAKCPDCGNRMKLRSLTMDCGVEGYANWVFGYSRSGFWSKCSFKKWKRRLEALGWSRRFWNRYRALKENNVERLAHRRR